MIRPLYPPIEPYAVHRLTVEAPHTLYVEECGNPRGIPVLFLHGGPGFGCAEWHRRLFHPGRYRIILFDQRGCGRSRPHGSVEHNNTGALLGDMEVIRRRLGITHWLLFGGSWGSTLALLYSEACSERVLGLILRGIFLCRRRDLNWLYQEGASRLFPDYWEQYLAPIPASERNDLIGAYHRRLFGESDTERMEAARAWSLWEGHTSTLLPSTRAEAAFGEPSTALALARISNHFFVHDTFLEPDQILRHAGLLNGISGVIVHGRYDVNCPLDNAWALHKAWPGGDLRIIPDAGHSAGETATLVALLEATDRFASGF